MKKLTPFHKGFPCDEKECESFFMFTKNSEKKNYNPLGAKLLWIEATQVVHVPHVACFDSFFVE